MEQALHLLVEPNYRVSSWCAEILGSLTAQAARHRVCIRELSPGDALPPPESPLVLLGVSQQYMNLNRRLLIAGTEPPQQTRRDVSYVTVDRRAAAYGLVRYLYGCGARRIALIGTNAAVVTDYLRFCGWADAVRELGIGDGIRDAFHCTESQRQSFQALMASIDEYDAVVCTNDFFALQLLPLLRERGVRVPEQVMLAGFGDTTLGAWSAPSLTTVRIHLAEIGRQAFSTWLYLMKNPMVRSMSVWVECGIEARGSTAAFSGDAVPPPPASLSGEPIDYDCVLRSESMQALARLEKVVSSADPTTLALLRGVARQTSNERLCEEAYLSYTAFKRRMNKLYQALGVVSKRELAALLTQYVPRFAGEDAPARPGK